MKEEARPIFICHSNYLESGKIFDSHWSLTFEFLEHYFKDDYITLRHSLNNGGESRVYSGGIKGPYKRIPIIGSLPSIFRYLTEIIFNLVFLLRIYRKQKRLVCVSIDPLSAFAPALLKRMGLRVSLYFITPDFARKRFSNHFLNKVYFTIDHFCTKNCSQNLCCAKTVIEHKKQLYGIEDTQTLVHFPNTPPGWIVNKYSNVIKTPFRIIYIGIISSQMDFKFIFREIGKIQKISLPQLHMVIVGDGDERKSLEKFVLSEGLANIITFRGKLEFDETMREVASAEVGIALYEGNYNYDEFRDSLKIREYQALSTIPFTTGVVRGNAEEIKYYQSGVVLDTISELGGSLLRVFSDAQEKKRLLVGCARNCEIGRNKNERLYRSLTANQ